MEPIVHAELIVSTTNYTGNRDSLTRNPQRQNLYTDDAGLGGKEPFAYSDDDFDKDNSHCNSAFLGARNFQEYAQTAIKKPHDVQYQPRSPAAIGQEFVIFSQQRLNDPQGDGTNVSIVRGGSGSGIVD
ncbi:hypothetical protein BG015_002511 [Linnemannia schmuckeri]|uniref:Uncharacterized protein n=1 Tax=Linnemannia schmuckeri TaxID=64567 RepID=A0A9P5S3R4_9FUNG|nr:hypothetical protein BG015_002511 [Linnemannia schmuckeri]